MKSIHIGADWMAPRCGKLRRLLSTYRHYRRFSARRRAVEMALREFFGLVPF